MSRWELVLNIMNFGKRNTLRKAIVELSVTSLSNYVEFVAYSRNLVLADPTLALPITQKLQ